MRSWDDVGLLTDLLDRHLRWLTVDTKASDWTILWTLTPFVNLLRDEPILSGIIDGYLREFDDFCDAHDRKAAPVQDALTAQFAECERSLVGLIETIGEDHGGSALSKLLSEVKAHSEEPEPLDRFLAHLEPLIARCHDEGWSIASLEAAVPRLAHQNNVRRKLKLRIEQFSACHPSAAYVRLQNADLQLEFHATEDPKADALQNKKVASLHKRVRDSAEWGNIGNKPPQTSVENIQRDVRTLHLALVTSLARDRSRWGIIQRFAARCESFDRERLIRDLKQKEDGAESTPLKGRRRKLEAHLTLEFARYLFDAGYNPLVDAAACGLRPDAMDVTSQPAIYVEAKKYENVSDGILTKLRSDLAQTLNTWERLAKRWDLPEAFLLIFRLSGRPIKLVHPMVRLSGRRLYVCCVDLGEAKESGSRSELPIQVNLEELVLGTPS
jgi:hypothetical protein